ncbi:MAG: cytoplasmic protein [Rhizobiaceae bacterium]
MASWKEEASLFVKDKEQAARQARQAVALQLACGIDPDRLATAGKQALEHAILRLRRAIERERLRGRRSHWSYDLNRHIAMKEALDGLKRLATTHPGSGA